MSFLGGLVHAAGGFFGLSSNRDNARAQGLTDDYGNAVHNNTVNYNNASTAAYQNYAKAQSGNAAYSTGLANNNYMGGAQAAYQNQLANYQQQQNASQMLYNQATGQAPSAADIQMQAGLGNANNQVQSAAYSQQGGVSPGLSQRNMLGAQAVQNANIVSQGAAMRAQEQQAAQGLYANQLANMGQTAGNMTAQQQSLGSFAYNQGQNNLNYNTALQQQLYGASNQVINNQQNVGATNTANAYNSQMTNLDQNWKANTEQAEALGNTFDAATGGLDNIFKTKPKVAGA